jgi:hypothetical protein
MGEKSRVPLGREGFTIKIYNAGKDSKYRIINTTILTDITD